jgi:hypothetical protein
VPEMLLLGLSIEIEKIQVCGSIKFRNVHGNSIKNLSSDFVVETCVHTELRDVYLFGLCSYYKECVIK